MFKNVPSPCWRSDDSNIANSCLNNSRDLGIRIDVALRIDSIHACESSITIVPIVCPALSSPSFVRPLKTRCTYVIQILLLSNTSSGISVPP